MQWNAADYDQRFGFVTDYGADLLELLPLAPPARIIDVGCGTGEHAAELTRRGFDVVGVDADPAMLRRARERHPDVEFLQADVQTLRRADAFDAAFSNAALHWMTDQLAALRSVRSVLRDGAPFVAEMGGRGNVATVDAALETATAAFEVPPIRKFFPSVGEQATTLEKAGFAVEMVQWFPRPTRLAHGQTPADWTQLFRANVWAALPKESWEAVARDVDLRCGDLQDEQGWFIDYWRLRFVARAG